MYSKHFGIEENPFSIAPDPRYLFMSEGHREALAHLLYGVKGEGGFVLLTGEVGTGKTTVCRCLLEQIPPDSNVAIILNPKITGPELLAAICDELAISYPSGNTSVKTFVDQINDYLLAAHAQGRKTVLIIDEAQNLETEVLEQIRLLTNLETNRQKLLQIIMLGQPELLAKLAQPELRQLAQRITARYHLGPLQKTEIGPYISHRLAVAGLSSQPFSTAAIDRLHKLSGGVPRLINTLCDRALLGAYVEGEKIVSRSTLARAAHEVFGELKPGRRRHLPTLRTALLLAGLLIAVLVAGTARYFRHEPPQPVPAPVLQESQPATIPEPPAAEPEPAAQQKPEEKASAVPAPASVDTEAAPATAQSMEWPANEPLDLSLPASYAALFARWGLNHTPKSEEEACRYAETVGLRCLSLQGELSNLLRLDQPAVLRLYDQDGGRYHATLVAAGTRSATLVFGKTTREIALEDIPTRWFGNFTILWRPPAGYSGMVQPGYRGEIIAWLDKQMATINHRPAQEQPNPPYNSELAREVKDFQRSRNLAPDGILGPQTLIYISKAAGLEMPALRSKKEAR